MFKFLGKMLLIAALCVPWATQAQDCTQTVPFSEDFESYAGVAYNATSGRILPTCWTGFTTINNYIPCVVSGTGSYVYTHGSKSMAMTGGTVATYGMNKYVLLPPMNEPLNLLQLSFWMCTEQSSATYGTLKVGYVTSDDTSTFVSIASYPSSAATVHSDNGPQGAGVGLEVELNLSQVPATATRLAFKWEHSNSSYHTCCIDDVMVDYIPTCPRPSAVAFSNITTDGATVSWTPTGSESLWEVVCGGQSFFSTDTFYTITGLNDNTIYNVAVRAICGAGDSSYFTNGEFRTACVAISQLPYSNDFENEPHYVSGTTPYADAFPACWHRINDATSTYNYYPYINSSTTYLIHGSKSMYWYHATSATYADNQYAVLPPVDLNVYDISDLTLSFWAKTTATAAPWPLFIVGVMTDATDATTFVPVDTITLTTAATMYNVSFANYTGTGNYIAIRSPRTTSARYMSLDDIYLTDEWCDMPEAVTATPTTNEVTISWESNGGTSFTVFLGQDTITALTDTFYTFQNLAGNTPYNYGVATECTSSNSIFVTGTVRTMCTYIDSLPYSENFDGVTGSTATSVSVNNLPPCWNNYNVGTSTSYSGYPIVYSSSTYAHSGSQAMRFYTYITAGTYADQYAIMPMTDPTLYPVNTLRVDFWMRANSTSYNSWCVVGVMSNPADASSFVPMETVYTNSSTTYAHHEVLLGSYNGPHGCIAFKFPQPTSGYNYGYVDDITLDLMPACPQVADLEVIHTAPDSIVVSWVSNGSETEWLVSDGVNEYVSYDTTYAFENLNSSTAYTITVRAYCNAGDTSDAVSVTAYTECEYATLPVMENFDSLTGSTATAPTESYLPNCWNYYNDGTRTNYQYAPYIYNNSTYAHSGSNCIRFYSYNSSGDSNQYLILPAVDSSEYQVSDLQLTFWLRGYSTSSNYFANVVVGVMTNPSVESSFIPYDTINYASTTYAYQEVNFNHYTGPEGRVTMLFPKPLSSSQYEYGYVDDIMLGPIPTCLMVEDLTATYSSADSIIIAWTHGGTENQWEVVYDSGSFIVTDTFFVAYNLVASTEYTFTVRAVCSDGDTSYPASVSARTQCGPITVLPYFESFEGLPVGASANLDCGIPCWGRLDNATQYHFGYIGNPSSWSTGGHTGTGFVYYYMPTTANTYADWIITILPSIDVTVYPLNTLQVSFWVKMNSATTVGDIQVGVISNINEDSTFVPLDTVHVAGNVYDLKTAYLSGYTGSGSNIALKFFRDPSTTTYYFVDDVTVEPMPDCPGVSNITMAGQTSDSLYITWSENGNATSWTVEYGTTGFTPGAGTTDIVTTLPYGIGNLNPNTAYDIYITPECTSGTAATRMATFRTACRIDTLPYFENFDSYTTSTTAATGVYVPCWDKIMTGTASYQTGSYLPQIYYSSSNAHSGNYSYRLYGIGYHMLPPMPTTLDSLQLTFWDYTTSTSYGLEVGVMDDTGFVHIQTINTPASTHQDYTIYFGAYTGNSRVIAFRNYYTSGTTTYYSYHYIDNVTVDYLPDCPPVSDIHLAGLDSNYFTVAWIENGSATSWDLEYGLHGFTRGTGTTVTVNTTPTYTITGLTANTEYDVYITPSCSGTAPFTMATFRTANNYVQLPFNCDFENATQNALWTLSNGTLTNKWHIGSATNNGGTNALYISDNNGTANNYTITSSTVVFAYTDVMISTPGDYGYSFDWKCYGESTLDYIRAALVPATETFTPGTTLPTGLNATSMPASWISLDGNSKLNLQSNWQTRADLVSIASAGVYHLVFVFRCDGSVGTQPPAAIDNVMIAYSPCARPSNITASNLTQTSVDLSWQEMGTATSWQYQLGSNAPVIVNDTFCNITGLTTNTAYTFRVRSICGNGDTSFWMVYNFRTLCGYLALPYIEDFENETTGSSSTGSAFVNCWTRLNNGTSYGGYPYVGGSTYNHTPNGAKGIYWYASTTATTYGDYVGFTLPPVDPSVGIDSLQLSFWTKASSASYVPVFQIGVMTDPNNISTFVGVDTVTVTTGTTWTLVEVPLVSYTGTGQYVAVKCDRPGSAWYAYVDDIVLEYVPTCLMPNNVHASASTTTSITIDWTDLSTASAWEIRYSEQGSTNTNTVVTTNHPYTISGLDTLTNYNVEVRAICTVGDTSRWSSVTSLGTETCDNAFAATTGPATSTSYYTPVNNYYKYTLTETIIDSAELDGIGEITAIAYSYAYSSPSTDKTDITIWLQPTTKTAFNSSSDIELLDSTIAVKVYEGNLNCSQGWNYFAFDTVYQWDGHSNLMVIVDDNSNDYNSNSYVFNSSSCSGYKTLAWYSDSENPNPTSSSYSGNKGYYQYRATMKLVSCGASCAVPSTLPATNVTYNSATLNWNSSASDFEVAVKAATDATWPAETAVTGNSYAVSGLQPATTYQFRVRAICDAAEELISDWTVGTFVTDSLPCFAPTDLQATATTYTTAVLGWTNGGEETMWSIHVWNSTYNQEFIATSNPYTVTGLTQTTTYYATVKSICGGGLLESEVSDTIQFTTATCVQVSGVTAAAVDGHSAIVSWNDAGVTSYQIEYGYTGFTTGQGHTITVENITSYTLTGLEPETGYDVYVRAMCETGVYGGWSAVASFTTPEVGISVADGMNVSIYPNPTSSSTTIALSGVSGEVAVSIVDMNGRVVMSDSMSCEGDCTKTMEVSGLAQGAYFVRISGEGVNMVKKLVVK